MSEAYNIFDDKEMNQTISMPECRKLREITNILTAGCMITRKEYIRLMVVYDGILKRMEKSYETN